MNSTLGLKARPNESFNAEFQPGQANDTTGANSVTASIKKMKKLFLIFIIFSVFVSNFWL